MHQSKLIDSKSPEPKVFFFTSALPHYHAINLTAGTHTTIATAR